MKASDLQTPCLVLDREKLYRNTEAMTRRMAGHGVRLRPHMKTAKSIDVAKVALAGNFGGVTVSTLKEAEYFAEKGVSDILLAVCITPDKFDRASVLSKKGVVLSIILDSVEVAAALTEYARAKGANHNVLIEIDSGEHRTGLHPDDPALLDIAASIDRCAHTNLAGVLTHGGHSYRCHTVEEIVAVAEQERAAAVRAAGHLIDAGLPCPVVSVGSTPTAVHVQDTTGVTEYRPGVYVFGDLFQAEIQSCAVSDIAVSVLATVISHRREHGILVINAGALALSKDLGRPDQMGRTGYGRLCNQLGEPVPGALQVTDVHQEHGEINGCDDEIFERFPVGSRVRVLPNHACMTAAMYDRYHVLDTSGEVVASVWSRINGW